MSLELEQWAVCVRQLEDVLSLQTLLCVPPPQGTPGSATPHCSVKALLEGGRGTIRNKKSIIPEGISDLRGLGLVRVIQYNHIYSRSVITYALSPSSGGIADSVAKWVFRQDLAPERLKDMLQRRGEAESTGQPSQPEQGEGEKSREDADFNRAAGECVLLWSLT